MKQNIFEIGSEYDWDSNKPYLLESCNGIFKDMDQRRIRYLRSGRDAIRYVARIHKDTHRTALLPALCCSCMPKPFEEEGYRIVYYGLNEDFTIDIRDVKGRIGDNCIFLYMNYFGQTALGAGELEDICSQSRHIITVEDITHDFPGRPVGSGDADYTVCSIRKWYATPDGGLVIGKSRLEDLPVMEDPYFARRRISGLKRKSSYLQSGEADEKQCALRSLAEEKQCFLREFREANGYLDTADHIAAMDGESRWLLEHMDFDRMYADRCRNTQVLQNEIKKLPGIRCLVEKPDKSTLYFPVLTEENQIYLEKRLSEDSLYVPVIWPLPVNARGICRYADYVSEHMIAVPCDHRYGTDDMKRIAAILGHAAGGRMMKKIMILGAGILQLPAITRARELGLDVVAVDMDPEAAGFTVEGIACEQISTIDIEGVSRAAVKHGIHGIMTLASDMPMRTVAVIAGQLGLAGISEDTAQKATNKAAMRQALREGNVPIPDFCCADTEEDYLKALKHFHGKVMVKPADNSGSRGVTLLESPDDTDAAVNAFAYSRQFSRTGSIVIEDFMEGPEVSVETLSVDGICHVIQITDKLTTGAPFFVEMGHSQPSRLPEETRARIEAAAIAANHAIGIKDGPSHTEIIVTPQGPKIVELGARLGGDHITTHLVPLSTGIDLVECCIRIALGETPDLSRKYDHGSAIRYFDTKQGTIGHITGIQEAQRVKGVRQVTVVKGKGSKAGEIHNSTDRAGFVIAQGENARDAIRACEEAAKMVEFHMDENV